MPIKNEGGAGEIIRTIPSATTDDSDRKYSKYSRISSLMIVLGGIAFAGMFGAHMAWGNSQGDGLNMAIAAMPVIPCLGIIIGIYAGGHRRLSKKEVFILGAVAKRNPSIQRFLGIYQQNGGAIRYEQYRFLIEWDKASTPKGHKPSPIGYTVSS